MQSDLQSAPDPDPRRHGWRLGVGAHLALGMAIMGAVVLVGQVVTNRITDTAVEAVSSLQLRYEPQARRASAIIEKLAAFDRQVEESLGPEGGSTQARRSDQVELETATTDLGQAMNAAFLLPQGRSQMLLKQQISAHISAGRDLAGKSGQRQHWLSERHQLL